MIEVHLFSLSVGWALGSFCPCFFCFSMVALVPLLELCFCGGLVCFHCTSLSLHFGGFFFEYISALCLKKK